MKKKKVRQFVLAVVLLLVIAMGTAFYMYTKDYYHTQAQDFAATEETEDYLIYGERESTVGFIFYPGAKVEETAYAPILSGLADNDVCCVVVKMPFHLAVLRPNAAEQVMEEFSTIEQWYIGGHSLGGAMAAGFAAGQQERLKGIILLAAYPTEELGTLPVLSVYGSEDCVLNHEKYQESIPLAKVLTEYVIEGGNHANFGNYGEQKGDGIARLPKEEQWKETIELIMEFLWETG